MESGTLQPASRKEGKVGKGTRQVITMKNQTLLFVWLFVSKMMAFFFLSFSLSLSFFQQLIIALVCQGSLSPAAVPIQLGGGSGSFSRFCILIGQGFRELFDIARVEFFKFFQHFVLA